MEGCRLDRAVEENRAAFEDATYLLSVFTDLLMSPQLSHKSLTRNLLLLVFFILCKTMFLNINAIIKQNIILCTMQ